MSSPDRELVDTVISFLESAGIHSVMIPRADTKTPDLLLAPDRPDSTLMELKEKQDDPDAIEELNEELDKGGIVSRSQLTNKWNRLDAITRAAVEQMQETDPERKHFRTIWIHCSGLDASLAEIRLKATLYGTQKLFCAGRPNIVTCHYFWNSSFYRFRNDLGGVVISRGENAQLNVNDHSPRFDSFLGTGLATAFGSAVYHPRQYLDDEDFMYHDSDSPRTNERDTLNLLRDKYGIEDIQSINMGMHSGMMRVENSE